MSLSSRLATLADFDFAREVHHLAYREVVLRQFGSWDDALQDRYFQENWDDGPIKILLCDGVPCGYVGVDYQQALGGIRLRELVIAPKYQRRGLGTSFLRSLFESAVADSVPIRLKVLKSNPARRLYARLGFRETNETDTHVVMEWRRQSS